MTESWMTNSRNAEVIAWRYARWCERCETPNAIVQTQEPYNDGMLFAWIRCMACGYSKTVRDDWQ